MNANQIELLKAAFFDADPAQIGVAQHDLVDEYDLEVAMFVERYKDMFKSEDGVRETLDQILYEMFEGLYEANTAFVKRVSEIVL